MSYGVFSEFYDALTANVSYDTVAQVLGSLLTRYGKGRGLLLDLACGTGSVSVRLAEKGYEVIGVDLSPEMLSEAQNKAYSAGQNILFLCQDMTALDLYGTVDAAVCTLDGLCHLPDEESVFAALQKVSLFMNPGGVFLFDVNSVYKHRAVLGNNTFVYDTDDVYCVWQNTLLSDGVTVQMDLDFFEPVSDAGDYVRQSERFTERAYPRETLEAMLKKAGFTVLDVFDGYSEKPAHDTSERLLFAVRKD
jgi:SAM-dependent methyltransferase